MIIFLLVCLSFHVAFAAESCTPDGGCVTDTLPVYGQLTSNKALFDLPNEAWTGLMQDDGNFVVQPNGVKDPVFQTNSQDNFGAKLVFQNDGNLVITRPDNKRVWSSGTTLTFGSCVPTNLVLQADSVLVALNSTNGVCWTTQDLKTTNKIFGDQDSFLFVKMLIQSQNERYTLTLGDQGNLVLLDGADTIWQTYTDGNLGAFFVLQRDGNLVLYNSTGNGALWTSNTFTNTNTANYYLYLQNDGNLVLYSSTGVSKWESYQNPRGGVMYPNFQLRPGKRLTSPNGTYYAEMSSGKLQVVRSPSGEVIYTWNAGPTAEYLIVTAAGDLEFRTSTDVYITGFKSANCGYVLTMQNDANLVLYSRANTECWTSRL